MGQGGRIQYQGPEVGSAGAGRGEYGRDEVIGPQGQGKGPARVPTKTWGSRDPPAVPQAVKRRGKNMGLGTSSLSGKLWPVPPMYRGDDDVCVTDAAEGDISTSRWWCW